MASSNPDIGASIRKFYFDLGQGRRDPDGRNASWDDCFGVFNLLRDQTTRRIHIDKATKEIAALHLGFYLASWGMFRTSGNLYKYTHRIHVPALRILLDRKYGILWNASPVRILGKSLESDYYRRLCELRKDLSEVYEKAGAHRRNDDKVNLTPTLYSKILLGTMAALPAYDRLFRMGLDRVRSRHGSFSKAFSKSSWQKLMTFYCDHQSEFEEARNGLVGIGQTYPPMKLLDMYFWQVGYDSAQKQRLSRTGSRRRSD